MIKTVSLNKTYSQGKLKITAVKDANLEITEKKAVLITGPSGAGKSTLLSLLGGLDRPTSGHIFFNGTDFYTLSDRARSEIRNEKIGFVFQFYHLLQEFTVLENVMLPALIRASRRGHGATDIKKRAEYLLALVGLANRLNHRPSELSGGESQRAAIVRALINRPDILLCDEPTGNLDSEKGEEIVEYLWLLKDKEGMSLVIVTHDERIRGEFDETYRICDGLLERINRQAGDRMSKNVCVHDINHRM